MAICCPHRHNTYSAASQDNDLVICFGSFVPECGDACWLAAVPQLGASLLKPSVLG
jgi:hypothetical protein